jgi:hypothetical protein
MECTGSTCEAACQGGRWGPHQWHWFLQRLMAVCKVDMEKVGGGTTGSGDKGVIWCAQAGPVRRGFNLGAVA